MYNDPVATPVPEAGPSAGPLAGSSTGPASGLSASIYAPGPILPGSTSTPGIAAHRKFKHSRVSNLKIDKITTLTGKVNYQS